MKWIDTTVGEYCPFIYGKGLPQRKRESGDVPVYGSNGIVDYHSTSYVKNYGIVIGRKGSVGAVHLSKGEFWPIDTAFYIEKESIEELYFAYFLLKSLGLEDMNSDSAVPGLNRDNAHALSIRIPESEDDRKLLGSWISQFNKKIEINSQTNQTLEQIAQALFKSWFVDFDPVKAKIAVLEAGGTAEEAELAAMSMIAAKSPEKLAELKQSKPDAYDQLARTAALFPSAMQESELGDIPEGWDISPFSKIAKLDTSSVKPNKKPDEQWEHYSIPAFDANQSPAFELGKTIKSGKYKVNPTSVLSSKLNPHFPRTWWPDVEDEELAICSTEFMQFVPHKAEYRPFMYGMITSLPFQQGIQQRVTGSTGSRQRAQPPQVASMDVVIPPEKLISMYSKRLISLHQKAAKNIKQNNQLSFLRDAILPEALSGRLFKSETKEA
jgi:type I restriction enzyme, S subunit